MTASFDFYFDFGSLASYLAHTQLPRISAATGAKPQMYPMLLGGVFQATGNASPMAVPAKGRYVYIDMKRFADAYGVPLVMNPHFPIITTTSNDKNQNPDNTNSPKTHNYLPTISPNHPLISHLHEAIPACFINAHASYITKYTHNTVSFNLKCVTNKNNQKTVEEAPIHTALINPETHPT